MQNNYLFRVMAIAMIFLFSGGWVTGQVSITSTTGTIYTQDFNSLSPTTSTTAVSWTNNSTISGWHLFTKDSNPIATYLGGNGAANSGSFYSFGESGNSDRAIGGAASGGAYFGSPASGAVAGWISAAFTNNSGSTISELSLYFNGEQWRNGGNASTQTMVLEYGFGNSFITVPSWTAPGGNFDWSSPVNSATAATVLGNSAGLVPNKGGNLSGINWANGTTLWIRWVERNDTGNDHGLAIDDFSLSIPITGPTLSINDVTLTEGNSGTTTYSFSVNSSVSAPIGGISFDISTADNTATTANNDYTTKSLTGLIIPEGSSSITFDVMVNGDTDAEPNETFFVNLSNIVGATASDAQGLGTITNDDATLPDLTINDVAITEANSGVSTATFTVSLSAPAPAGGVNFTINTANGTAIAGSDYDAITNGAGTIATGETSTTFTVNIVGDIAYEANETFFVNLTSISNANPLDVQGLGTITNDDSEKIHDIQGSGLTAALTGTRTVTGIVTRAFLGATKLNGFYMQEEDTDADADPNTSEGIFVFSPTAGVSIGDLVQVTGTVIDFSTTASGNTSLLTEFSPTTSIIVLSSGNPLPTAVNVSLPVTNLNDLEKYEGMLVNLTAATGNLVVTDNFNLGRYGQLVLAANDPTTNALGTDARIDQYTQFNPPSVAGNTAYLAAIQKRLIYVDDANGSQNIDPILFGRGGNPLTASNTLRTGDEVASVTAVLDQRFEGYRLQIGNSSELNILPTNARPTTPGLAGNPTLVVGNMNVLNYFNGDGLGGGFPTPRGANTSAEFTRQRDKIINAIVNSGADILSLNEIENDGFEPESAIQDLVNGLNAATAPGTWAFVAAPVGTVLSTDQITCAMIYKPAKASPVGDIKALTTGEFIEVGRGAIAQTFRQNSNNAKFTLVGNHFKSKGSLNAGLGNSDTGDGQGNNNGQRTRQAQELAAWLANDPTGSGDADILIVGDLNSYAKEDPIITLETAGYNTLIPATNTSYQFDGAHGALDHALGNSTLQAQVVSAKKWNINADEPVAIDYNIQLDNGTIIKTAGQIASLYNADQYRNSDHDPVLVGLNLACDAITFNETVVSACDTYTWANNGQTYTSSGTYTGTTTNCITEKLVLTINTKASTVVTNATICSNETYTWAVNGQTYSSATTVTVVGEGCNADQTLNLTIDNSICSDAICTTLPADYANSAFMACTPSGSPVGVGVLMNNALNSLPKVFGLTVNNRTFTLDPTDISANVYTMMAGTSNGSSKFGLGGASYTTSSTWPRVPLTSGGQIANALFRNALALYFNLQNSTKLGVVPMTNIQHTQPLTACGALTGTGVISSYQMPTAVISYLNGANGYPATVAGLYTLANDALGGKTGVPNLSTIASAMDKINKAFNGCRLISTPSTTPSVFGTGLKVTENNQAFNAPAKGGLYVTLIEGDVETGNIMGVTEIGADGISGFEPILNNTYKLILGTNPEGSRISQAPTGYKIVGEKVTYYNEDQSITNSGNTSFADGEVEIGTANTNAGAKVAAGSRIEVEFVLEPSSPLPLNLISFSATKTAENENTLNWNTSNQVNFAGFEIQKSTDAKAFEPIGNISAANFSKNKYSFIDKQATESFNYYRLKMNDLDGKFEYSKIVSVKNESIQATIGDFYPNPSQSFTQIKINASKADTYTIVAHDLMGRILQTDKMDLKEGENIVKYQTNNLPKGLSFIRIEANGISVYRKLLKN